MSDLQQHKNESIIYAVMVAYRPDLEVIRTSLMSVVAQVERVVLVDNTEGYSKINLAWLRTLSPKIILIDNKQNKGLATAFNQGIDYALARKVDYVMLMDQDSQLEPSTVQTLLSGHQRLSNSHRVAAVGPCYVNSHTGQVSAFSRYGFPFNERIYPSSGETVACDFLISSGSLISARALNDIGKMDDALFIDSVDIEWCMRAKKKDWEIYGVGAARMRHTLGDRVHRIPFNMGNITVHSPQRLYLMTRNRVALYRRNATPRLWIAQDIPRLLFKFIRLSLFVSPRVKNARAMYRGFRDGLAGRLSDGMPSSE